MRCLDCATVCAVLGALLCNVCQANPAAPVPVDGNYAVKVGGFYTGTGQGAVSGTSLNITATISDDAGNTGMLSMAGVAVDPKNHFTGSGTVLGKSFKVSGRLDPVTANETQLKTARLTANFLVIDGHHGRLAGFIGVTPGTTPPSGGSSGGSGSGSGGSSGGGSGDGSGATGGNPVPTPTPTPTPAPTKPTPVPKTPPESDDGSGAGKAPAPTPPKIVGRPRTGD